MSAVPTRARVEHLTEHVDEAGMEETCLVFISSAYSDVDSGGVMPAAICVGESVDLTPGQAREVGARLLELAAIVEADGQRGIE